MTDVNTTNTTTRQRTAVVTGAGGGVGGRLVRSLALQGWSVIGIVRSRIHADELNKIDGVAAIVLDLLDPDSFVDADREICERFDSRLDLLVHAAAVAAVGHAVESDVHDWHTVLGTNLVAPALLTGHLIKAIRKAQGTVVFINSGAGERAVANHAVYAASKHGLRGYADTLRLEESPHRVRVSTIYPGQIATKMLKGIDHTLGVAFIPEDYIDPQTVADAVIWVANATADVHISNLDLRPRQEVSAAFNV